MSKWDLPRCLERSICFKVLFSATLFALWVLPPAAAESDGASRFQFHGFLTQAIATADFGELGATPNDVILGIPDDDTTTDYRFLALQFRYKISEQDIVIVQLSSRSLGDSPINDVEDDIELDWAFYERRLADDSSVKVGRIQIPLGIYNEIRDVGTILPFYRPPFTFYNEGSFTSETVDGLLFHHTFAAESDWSLSLDAYYGEFDLVEQAAFDPTATPAIAVAKDVIGIQLWLSTPILGLRFGLGGQERDVTEGQEGVFRLPGDATHFEDWYVSGEYSGTDWRIRSEYRETSAPLGHPTLPFFADEALRVVYYGQIGYFFTQKFGVFLQYEANEVELESPLFTRKAEQNARQDTGLSFNYSFSPNVVLKAEYHEVDQELQRFVPVLVPGGFRLDPFVTPNDGGNYSILSLAVSF